MRKHLRVPAVAVLLVLFSFVSSSAEDYNNNKALVNISTAKVYFDVNIGIPIKLATRMALINKTYSQLVNAGLKPDFVVGFRGKASYFVTKGDDYVLEENLLKKKEVHEWIRKFKERGIVMEQCLIAAGFHDIDPNDFLKDVQVVLNGYISMIGYQAKGYSQVPMD